MKVAFVSYKYNWDSFSIIKSMFETLQSSYDAKWYDLTYKNDGYNPDMIWNVGYKTVPVKTDVFTVNFGLSDPAKFIETKTKSCDIYCTNDLTLHKQNPSYYHFSCFSDKRYHQPMNVNKDISVLFFGNRNHKRIPWRGEFVDKIRKQNVQVKAFGDGWGAHKDDGGFISGVNMLKIINRAKICLDVASDTSSLAHRLFEASCCGVPVITKNRADVEALFNPDQEIITYDNADDMVQKILYYLDHLEELEAIGENARKRCLNSHDVTHRIDALMKFLKEKI